MTTCQVQPFDGSLDQARGVLSIEETTFGECPYSPEQIACLFGQPAQHALVALIGDRVVGFAATFETDTIASRNLEVDLLAVHSSAQSRGIGQRLLIEARNLAVSLGGRKARGLVATPNEASRKAFIKAGYIPTGNVRLMVHDRLEPSAPPLDDGQAGVALLSQADELRQLGLTGECTDSATREILAGLRPRQHQVWVTRENGAYMGFCETLWVDTLLYTGIWIESLHARRADRRIISRLVAQVLCEGQSAGLDRIGILVDQAISAHIPTLRQLGFQEIGEYQWHEFRSHPQPEG